MAIATEEFIKQIDEMTVLDLNNLVKSLEEHYGVSAAAATVAVAGGGGGEAAQAEEQTEFNVMLTSFGDKKINVIKVRACDHGAGPQGGQGVGRIGSGGGQRGCYQG